jgi:predicted RNA binding protein YcfA (HicA-like mRNA interferase family)
VSKKYPPLTCKQVKRALKKLGFTLRSQEGSHEQWIGKDLQGKFAKVTVDCPKAPFSDDLTKWMAKQAGRTVAQLYAALND